VLLYISVTELAREQPLDSDLTSSKTHRDGVTVSAVSASVLPSPDVLNSLDMIHSWLQQSEKQAVTVASFTHTSNLPTIGLVDSPRVQSKSLPVSTSKWQPAGVHIGTVRCIILYMLSVPCGTRNYGIGPICFVTGSFKRQLKQALFLRFCLV